ncbi:PaaX family transcriptional regulator C-terminal domain-containing protein [Frankia sp. QA3]|uniref:PaaX family transcriptional regulator n=1 Tax=Frankia sp. QA3 TaxID=710111 RepID=UPI000269BDF7|nr:PaaX family transcriptional regulator C-terminal domain-containing protein [Frankia sp. QA3]EIV92836.1 phenylacetic acid-responsive transcriptional repressor [Frankia sp. QA3]
MVASPAQVGADLESTALAAGRRPQQLLLGLLGAVVMNRHPVPVPTRVFLRIFGSLGIGDAATRATLARMTRSGLLARHQLGRTAAFRLTDRGEGLLREAASRVQSSKPFEHADGEWTLLSFSLPESRRDLRHQLRARLTWAGFGPLRDGLWIAPGTVDVDKVLADVPLGDDEEQIPHAFVARPAPPTRLDLVVRRAWDLAELRAEHERFLRLWERHPATGGKQLAELTLFVSDWLRLLRADPGLPAAYLPEDWPSARSVATYLRLRGELEGPARTAFGRLVGSP